MKIFPIFAVLATVGVAVAHYLVIVFVPIELIMGGVQKIFYFHVPSAWLCYLGFILCFFGSLSYLIKRNPRHELFALASAEVGLIFGLIVLVTGPLWARAAWGVWWKWEPRLTSMALLIMVFAAYWVLRSFGGKGEGVRKFAAVLAVFGTPNIIFVHEAVKRWRGDHPNNVIRRSDPDMRMTLFICLGILIVVFILLLINRFRSHREAGVVRAMRRRLSRLGGA